MKVLVTGGAGFIGSHVIEELLNNQYEIVVIDNLVTGFSRNLSQEAKLYKMDLSDPALENVFEQEKPEYVIHLAAQASVTASMNDPYLDFSTNTVGTVRMMLLSEKYRVKKFLFASTAAVYGEPTCLPIDEKEPLNPQSFYALSKYTAESYIQFIDACKSLDSCILRFSNVYGPRQNVNGEAGVVSIFINRLLENERICIYDGSQTRDFIYVKDVAVACRLALEGEHTGIFNISSCTETTINDLYHLITEKIADSKKPYYVPKRVGEIDRSTLDNRKARSEFEWDLQYTLPMGLKETVDYYSKRYFTQEQKRKLAINEGNKLQNEK